MRSTLAGVSDQLESIPQVLLDFDFPPDLNFGLVIDDFGLVHALESEDKLGFHFGSDHIDTTELSLPERLPHLKHIQLPFASSTSS